MSTITIDPVTRLEGHLKVALQLDSHNTVTSAATTGNLFRNFENILIGRDPRDAIYFTQRICGLCPMDHAIAAAKTIENSVSFVPNTQARLIRNLIQGANYLSDHILHFYHLALMDYVAGPQMPPWTPGYNQDYRLSSSAAATLQTNYVEALKVRRQCQEMGAILSGKMPHAASIVAGGVTVTPTASDINNFKNYLTSIKTFIDNTYLADVNTIAEAYKHYFHIGKGYGNLLTYGAFDTDDNGNTYFVRGRYTKDTDDDDTTHFVRGRDTEDSYLPVDTTQIIENTAYSWYDDAALNPGSGTTTPDQSKTGAYSWLKAPRYAGIAYEVGPLARVWMNNAYRNGISVMDRHKARVLETQLIAGQMESWIDGVAAGASGYTQITMPTSGTGAGFTEAPRGALGHWLNYSSSLTTRYQIVTPTCWNASPKDNKGKFGPIEQALVGVQVADPTQPVEVLRVIHSFDPCTGCSVHVLSPEQEVLKEFVINPFGA
jgi:hydrogenase large subunit